MQKRFTFIKTDEVFDGESEERVEVEVKIEEGDITTLEDKFRNFLKGCGFDASVTIRNTGDTNSDWETEPHIEQDSDVLQDVHEVDNIHAFKRAEDYDGKPSDTE